MLTFFTLLYSGGSWIVVSAFPLRQSASMSSREHEEIRLSERGGGGGGNWTVYCRYCLYLRHQGTCRSQSGVSNNIIAPQVGIQRRSENKRQK